MQNAENEEALQTPVQLDHAQQQEQKPSEPLPSPVVQETKEANPYGPSNQLLLQQFFVSNGVEFNNFFNEMSEEKEGGSRCCTSQVLLDVLSVFFTTKGLKLMKSEAELKFQQGQVSALMQTFINIKNHKSSLQQFYFEDAFKFLSYLAQHHPFRFVYEAKKKEVVEPAPPPEGSSLQQELLVVKGMLEQRLKLVTNPGSVHITISALQAIEHQLADLAPPAPVPKQTESPKRKEATQQLRLLFQYYCKSSYHEGRGTFDQISTQGKQLNKRKFISLCNDFKLVTKRLDVGKLLAIFRKTARNQLQMEFSGFQAALSLMAEEELGAGCREQYLTRILGSNLRRKLKEVHKEPFIYKYQNPSQFSAKPYSLLPHTGKLPSQIQQELGRRKEARDQKARQKSGTITGKSQLGSVVGSRQREVSRESRSIIDLRTISEMNADKTLLRNLFDEPKSNAPQRRVKITSYRQLQR